MHQAHPIGRAEDFRELLSHIGGILQIQFLGPLDDRADDKRLIALRQPCSQEIENLPFFRLRHQTGGCRDMAPGEFLDDRDVHIAVNGHGKRSRDRSCRHHEQMRVVSLPVDQSPLSHSETVLLIDDDQAKVPERQGPPESKTVSR